MKIAMEPTSPNPSFALALAQLPKVGRARLRKMLEVFGHEDTSDLDIADAVRRCQAEFTLPDFSASDIELAVDRGVRIHERCAALNIRVHPYKWSSYPSQLTRLADPPALLFSLGTFDHDRTPRVAVIGTRKPTEWGLSTAKACATQIAAARGIVVSGLALGVDGASHSAVVEHHGTTWAVLAHGLHMVSPLSHRELATQIVAGGGALLSEYAPGEHAQRFHFIERDRIQAGLVDAVLVIESGVNGGAMHTVRFAREAGVPVWVTFPETEINAARAQTTVLPEPQQGTWELLRTRAALRVATRNQLSRLLSEAARS